MASEGASTSPPAVVGSSFSIENLLNLSDSTAKKEHTNPLTDNLSSYSVPGSSFPSVPRAVQPFSHDCLSLPLCTPLCTFNFGEIVDPHSVTYIHQFPISNNGPPLGVELFKIKRRRAMKKKKQRPLFSTHQIQTMEKEFRKCRYVTESRRTELSSELNLTETQVKTWFQNRRTKSKKEIRDKQEQLSSEIRRRPFELCDQYLLQRERNFPKPERHMHSICSLYAPSTSLYFPLLGRSVGLS